MTPMTITAEYKDGFVSGKMNFTASQISTIPNNVVIIKNVILVEGYHKYGTEEHYFIPRAGLSEGVG